MDIAVASAGLILIAPLFGAIAALIKIASPGPVFFRQDRVGYFGKVFTLYKFRTMHVNADPSLHRRHLASLISAESTGGPGSCGTPMQKLDGDNDPRIIPFGKLLRRSCLDELPQLINVLRGEMSLVGPRPPIPYEVEEYSRWHTARFDAVPGMTGLWQVSGKNRLSFREMVLLDIRYSRERSLWLDALILLLTPLVVVTQIRDGLARAKPEAKGVAENA